MLVSILFFLRTTDVPMADVGLVLGVAGRLRPFILVWVISWTALAPGPCYRVEPGSRRAGYGAWRAGAAPSRRVRAVGAVAAITERLLEFLLPMVAAATGRGRARGLVRLGAL